MEESERPDVMIGQVRACRPAIILNGQDFYGQLAPYLLSLSYTDNSDGKKADDLQFQLADRDKRFISDWMPDKGVYVDVSIICERWFSLNAPPLSLDCGRFWIDSIDFELPQSTVSVKATSIPTTAHCKSSDETRGWENSTLKDISQQIAGENGMELDWQSDVNPKYARVEQTEETALGFLQKRAGEAKLAIKVHRNKIVVFDEQKLEEAEPQFQVVYGNGLPSGGLPIYRMSSGHFATKLTDATKAATVSHVNPRTGTLTKQKYSASGDEPDDTYNEKVNDDPGYSPDEDSGAEDGGGDGGLRSARDSADSYNDDAGGASDSGQRRAKAEVRDKNKEKDTASIALSIGNPLIAAGMTFNLVGVGQFDGKYFVQSANHDVGEMYETKLTVRKCLQGY
jgi:hypothetical protein